MQSLKESSPQGVHGNRLRISPQKDNKTLSELFASVVYVDLDYPLMDNFNSGTLFDPLDDSSVTRSASDNTSNPSNKFEFLQHLDPVAITALPAVDPSALLYFPENPSRSPIFQR